MYSHKHFKVAVIGNKIKAGVLKIVLIDLGSDFENQLMD